VPKGCQFRTRQGAVRQVDREDLLHRSSSGGRNVSSARPRAGRRGRQRHAAGLASPFQIQNAFKLLYWNTPIWRNVRPHQQINQGRDEEIGNST